MTEDETTPDYDGNTAQEILANAQANHRNNTYPESVLDLHVKINDTEAKELFSEFIRDFPNSNFNEMEIVKIRDLFEMLSLLEEVGAEDAFKAYLRDIYAIMNSSRARNGFERKMTVSQITKGETTVRTSKEGKQSAFFMNFKKNKGGKQ